MDREGFSSLGIGGTRILPAGVYVGGARQSTSSLPVNIHGISVIDDASANHGEGNSFGLTFEHATLSPDAPHVITVIAKMWSNGWHEQWIDGTPLFALGGFSSMASGGTSNTPDSMPGTTCSGVTAATVVNPFQFNAFLYKVTTAFVNAYREETAGGAVPQYGVGGIQGIARPLADIINFPELVWMNKELSLDAINILGGNAVEETKRKVKLAYEKFPNLGWLNGKYISRNLHFLGIAKTTLVDHRTGCVRVSVVALRTARCFEYWPNAKPFDYVGFVLTNVEALTVGIRQPNNFANKRFVLIPWSSSCSKTGISDERAGFLTDESLKLPTAVGRVKQQYHGLQDDDDDEEFIITFAIGRLVLAGPSNKVFRSFPYIDPPVDVNRNAWELTGLAYPPTTIDPNTERAYSISKMLTQTMVIDVAALVFGR